MIATIPSASLLGADGEPVAVEVHVSNGVPGFTIVGLPDAACREARDRVRAALLSSGLPWPLRRVTVNLAPSSLRKVGAGLDLAIAVGLLVATADLPAETVDGCGFLGELGLDGSLRAIPGALALVAATRAPAVVVPAGCLREARMVEGRRALGARSLARSRGGPARPGGVGSLRPGARSTGRDRRHPRAGRRARSARRSSCGGGGGGRRPSPAAGRTARGGQDDAGSLPSRAPAAAHARGGPRDAAHPLRRGRAAVLGPRRPAALPRPAPLGLSGGVDRRGHRIDASGRGQPGEQRRAVPRRARRVRAVGARDAAPTARGGSRPSGAGTCLRLVPGALLARRGDQPLPVR